MAQEWIQTLKTMKERVLNPSDYERKDPDVMELDAYWVMLLICFLCLILYYMAFYVMSWGPRKVYKS
jgi:hypothetical protein